MRKWARRGRGWLRREWIDAGLGVAGFTPIAPLASLVGLARRLWRGERDAARNLSLRESTTLALQMATGKLIGRALPTNEIPHPDGRPFNVLDLADLLAGPQVLGMYATREQRGWSILSASIGKAVNDFANETAAAGGGGATAEQRSLVARLVAAGNDARDNALAAAAVWGAIDAERAARHRRPHLSVGPIDRNMFDAATARSREFGTSFIAMAAAARELLGPSSLPQSAQQGPS